MDAGDDHAEVLADAVPEVWTGGRLSPAFADALRWLHRPSSALRCLGDRPC